MESHQFYGQKARETLHEEKMSRELVELYARVISLTNENANLQAELRDLKNSRSWKITAPLRKRPKAPMFNEATTINSKEAVAKLKVLELKDLSIIENQVLGKILRKHHER